MQGREASSGAVGSQRNVPIHAAPALRLEVHVDFLDLLELAASAGREPKGGGSRPALSGAGGAAVGSARERVR